MESTNFNKQGMEPVFSTKFRAGRRRTYFFDVRTTRQNDYYLTITESKKRMDGGYDRHKIFLYKEDFNKFLEYCTQTINHVKTELMPEYDFDEFAKRQEEWERNQANGNTEMPEANNNGNSISANTEQAPVVSDNITSDSTNDTSTDTGTTHDANEDDLKW